MAFVGQGMSSTVMPYHMINMDMAGESQKMQMMDHSKHNMIMIAAEPNLLDESQNDSCCLTACDCYTSGCSTFIAIIKEPVNVPAFDFSKKIQSNTYLVITRQSKSLFRPPIFS
jgi:hypothetical protein